MTLRVPGEGEAGERGGPPGNLYVVIHVEPHPIFDRYGDDILCEVPISFTTAALGGEIEVPTLNGKARLKIPPGTASGQIFRLKGKGIKTPQSDKTGDMYLALKIIPPTDLDDDSQQLLEDLAQKHPQDDIRKQWS